MARKVPSDEGWSWVVMFGTSICMFFVVGMFRSQGILFVEFIMLFGSSQSVSAWMVGVTACGLSLVAPFANYFAVKYSSRVVVMVGSIMCATGAFITSWAPNIQFVIVVFGGLTGCGYSCMFGPSLMMIGQYFEKRRSFANAGALAGASVGCLLIPPAMTALVEYYTIRGTLIVYSAFVLNTCVAAMMLRPPSFYTSGSSCCPGPLVNKAVTDSLEREEKVDRSDLSCRSDINVSPAVSNQSLQPNICLSSEQSECPKTSSCSKLHSDFLSVQCKSVSDRAKGGSAFNLLQHKSVKMCKETEGHFGSTKSLDMNKIIANYKLPIENKSLTLLRRVNGHYTSKESLFVVEGQEIPKAMVEEEIKLQKEHEIATAVSSRSSNKCNKIPCLGYLCQFFEWHNCSNSLFIIFSISVGIGNSAYVDHFIIIPPHASDLGYSKKDAAMLLSIAGGLDVVGRLLAGWFADLNLIKRWRLMSLAMITTGISTTICSFFKVFPALIVLSVVLGFVSGIQVALFTVVLLDFVGLAKFPGAFGIFMLFMGVFNSSLPSFLGYLRDQTGSHQSSFLTVGVLMIFSGALLWLEPFARKIEERKEQKIIETSSNQ